MTLQRLRLRTFLLTGGNPILLPISFQLQNNPIVNYDGNPVICHLALLDSEVLQLEGLLKSMGVTVLETTQEQDHGCLICGPEVICSHDKRVSPMNIRNIARAVEDFRYKVGDNPQQHWHELLQTVSTLLEDCGETVAAQIALDLRSTVKVSVAPKEK